VDSRDGGDDFTGWVYDRLMKYSPRVKVAHPAMLKAISAGKKKNDRVDAQNISDLLRCIYFPECYMASREIRDRRRVLRYRNLLIRQSIQMKNRIGSMLMETGISYNKQKLHRRGYFKRSPVSVMFEKQLGSPTWIRTYNHAFGESAASSCPMFLISIELHSKVGYLL
jgi:hypothetical protein